MKVRPIEVSCGWEWKTIHMESTSPTFPAPAPSGSPVKSRRGVRSKEAAALCCSAELVPLRGGPVGAGHRCDGLGSVDGFGEVRSSRSLSILSISANKHGRADSHGLMMAQPVLFLSFCDEGKQISRSDTQLYAWHQPNTRNLLSGSWHGTKNQCGHSLQMSQSREVK